METYIAHNLEEALQWEQEHLDNKIEGLCVLFHDRTMVQLGNQSSYDIDAVKPLKCDIWQSAHKSGTIVCFPGDLSLYQITYNFNQFCEIVGYRAVEYFKSLDLPSVETHNNDILVRGQKIASYAEMRLSNDMIQSLVHFSINTNVDLIKKICTKNINKYPGALSEYHITAEMVYKNIL